MLIKGVKSVYSVVNNKITQTAQYDKKRIQNNF